MAISTAGLNVAANALGGAITHIGLVNEGGDEITGGGYARQAASWTSAANGRVDLAGNLSFDVAASTTVAGWRGYSASTGGTNYGGFNFTTPEAFGNPGTFTLLPSLEGQQTFIGFTGS